MCCGLEFLLYIEVIRGDLNYFYAFSDGNRGKSINANSDSDLVSLQISPLLRVTFCAL